MIFAGCNKDQADKDKIPGKWISTDQTDTLVFVDYTNLWRWDTGYLYGDH